MSASDESVRIDTEILVRDVLVDVGEQVKNPQAKWYASQVFANNLYGAELLWHCKYVLVYLRGWRGDSARSGKQVLKDYIAKYEK